MIQHLSLRRPQKNKGKKRDPEAHSVKKGNQWHFGYKAHIGVDSKTGLVHHVKATAANVHDVNDVIYGDEDDLYGDSAYLNVEEHISEDKKAETYQGKYIFIKINFCNICSYNIDGRYFLWYNKINPIN